MITLIIPCAGSSSRFPNMKPKWLLTHPDGKLMIEKSLEGFNLDIFDRIIITIVKKHDEDYEASLILNQVFANNKKVEICILDNFTKSASETIFLTLEKMNIKDKFIIKDSDNYVKINIKKDFKNFIAGYDLHKHPKISNIPEKSFIVANKQDIIQDIIEKQVVSNIICIGVYAFEDTGIFKNAYLELSNKKMEGELFVSHIISYLLSTKKYIFIKEEATDYNDWGSLKEWREVQKQYRTYFVDADGVLFKNRGKYGSINWSDNNEIIKENIEVIKKLQDNNAQIIITTSRTEEYRKNLELILAENGIKPYAFLMGLNHSARVLINDFAPTNPYPSAIAVNIQRNNSLEQYID